MYTLSPRSTSQVIPKQKTYASFAGVEIPELREISRGVVRAQRDCTSMGSPDNGKQTRGYSRSKVDPPSSTHYVPCKSVEKVDPQRHGIGMVVEATIEQQELMRRISVLGMRDPISGNRDRVKKNSQNRAVDKDKRKKDRMNTSDHTSLSPVSSASPPQPMIYRRESPPGHRCRRSQNPIEDQGYASPAGSHIHGYSPASKRHGRMSPVKTVLSQHSPNVARDSDCKRILSAEKGRISQRSVLSHETEPTSSSLSQSLHGYSLSPQSKSSTKEGQNAPRVVVRPPTLVPSSSPSSSISVVVPLLQRSDSS